MKTLFCAIVFLLLISPVNAVSVKPVAEESYTCYDYSVAYAREHPDWGIVTMSDNQYFRGVSHMVNYQLTESGSLNIHDGLYKTDYTCYEWQGYKFYHFWTEGTPIRNYKVLQDNSYIYENKV